jgi:hypothetical protein
MPAGIFYDGDYTIAKPVSGLEIEQPFEFQPWVLIYRQKFQQFLFNPFTGQPCFQALAMSVSPAQSGMTPAVPQNSWGGGPFLVNESPRVDIGAGIMEWTRTWANVPSQIYEFPALNFSRQNYAVSTVPWVGYTDPTGNFQGSYKTVTSLEEWPEPTQGIVHRRFKRISDTFSPEKILAMCQPQIPFRLVKITDERGTEHVFQFGTQGIAEPTSVTRWMGEIREIRDVYVTPNIVLGQNFGEWLASPGFSAHNLPPTMTLNANGFPQGFNWISPGNPGGYTGVSNF